MIVVIASILMITRHTWHYSHVTHRHEHDATRCSVSTGPPRLGDGWSWRIHGFQRWSLYHAPRCHDSTRCRWWSIPPGAIPMHPHMHPNNAAMHPGYNNILTCVVIMLYSYVIVFKYISL